MFFRSAKASVSPHWLLLHVGIPCACACLSILLWRVVRIRRLFRSGISVAGTITALRLTKDRGRLEFSYVIDGVTHETWQPVHQSRDVLALQPGQKVSVLISPRDSSVAVVRHLFDSQAPNVT